MNIMDIKIRVNFKKLATLIYTTLSKFNIGHLLLLCFGLHLFLMASVPDAMIFDEGYYIPAARTTLSGAPTNIEHTPLVKLLVAYSIEIFGDWWFAWRLPVVVMGVVSVYVLYKIAKYFMSERHALIAATIFAFDVLYFVHSSIVVLDVPAILFGLVGLYFYLSKHHKLSALSLGIAFLMKEVGLFFVAIIVAHSIGTYIQNLRYKFPRNTTQIKENFKQLTPHIATRAAVFSLILLVVCAGGIQLYIWTFKPAITTGVVVYNNVVHDQDGNPITTQTAIKTSTNLDYINNPVEYLKNQYNYFTGFTLNFSKADQRPAWTWVLPIDTFWNPPHYLTVSLSAGEKSLRTLDWVSAASPFVEVFCFPILVVAIINLVRKQDVAFTLLLLCGIGITFFTWFGLSLYSAPNYTNFNYYILYSIPFFALGIPYFWQSLVKHEKLQKSIMLVHLILILSFFIYYFPLKLFRVM